MERRANDGLNGATSGTAVANGLEGPAAVVAPGRQTQGQLARARGRVARARRRPELAAGVADRSAIEHRYPARGGWPEDARAGGDGSGSRAVLEMRLRERARDEQALAGQRVISTPVRRKRRARKSSRIRRRASELTAQRRSRGGVGAQMSSLRAYVVCLAAPMMACCDATESGRIRSPDGRFVAVVERREFMTKGGGFSRLATAKKLFNDSVTIGGRTKCSFEFNWPSSTALNVRTVRSGARDHCCHSIVGRGIAIHCTGT